MAFKRAFRAGQTVRLPVLCDPDYQARRARRIRAAMDDAASAYIQGEHPDRRPVRIEEARVAAVDAIEAEESRYRDTLDPACLTTDLDGVTHVLIRALPGEAFAQAEEVTAISVSRAKLAEDDARRVRYTGGFILAVLRRGLIDPGIDGTPVTETGEYPLEALYGPGGLGSAWPSYSAEVYSLIHAWSHMGESDGSSCAPSHAEPI